MKKSYQLFIFLIIILIPVFFVFINIFRVETVTIIDKGKEFLYYTYYYKDVKALFQEKGYDQVIDELKNQFTLSDIYYVKKGDTIWRISLKFRLKRNEIIALIILNYIVDPDEIYIGQRLEIFRDNKKKYKLDQLNIFMNYYIK